MEGVLTARSRRSSPLRSAVGQHHWKTRWFVLAGDTLEWYTHRTDGSMPQPRGQARLERAALVTDLEQPDERSAPVPRKGAALCLKLTAASLAQPLYVRAADADEKSRWAGALQRNIYLATNPRGGVLASLGFREGAMHALAERSAGLSSVGSLGSLAEGSCSLFEFSSAASPPAVAACGGGSSAHTARATQAWSTLRAVYTNSHSDGLCRGSVGSMGSVDSAATSSACGCSDRVHASRTSSAAASSASPGGGGSSGSCGSGGAGAGDGTSASGGDGTSASGGAGAGASGGAGAGASGGAGDSASSGASDGDSGTAWGSRIGRFPPPPPPRLTPAAIAKSASDGDAAFLAQRQRAMTDSAALAVASRPHSMSDSGPLTAADGRGGGRPRGASSSVVHAFAPWSSTGRLAKRWRRSLVRSRLRRSSERRSSERVSESVSSQPSSRCSSPGRDGHHGSQHGSPPGPLVRASSGAFSEGSVEGSVDTSSEDEGEIAAHETTGSWLSKRADFLRARSASLGAALASSFSRSSTSRAAPTEGAARGRAGADGTAYRYPRAEDGGGPPAMAPAAAPSAGGGAAQWPSGRPRAATTPAADAAALPQHTGSVRARLEALQAVAAATNGDGSANGQGGGESRDSVEGAAGAVGGGRGSEQSDGRLARHQLPGRVGWAPTSPSSADGMARGAGAAAASLQGDRDDFRTPGAEGGVNAYAYAACAACTACATCATPLGPEGAPSALDAALPPLKLRSISSASMSERSLGREGSVESSPRGSARARALTTESVMGSAEDSCGSGSGRPSPRVRLESTPL